MTEQLELDLQFKPKPKPKLNVLRIPVQKLIEEFHETYGCAVDDRTDETLNVRTTLIDEEVEEVFQELFYARDREEGFYDPKPVDEVDLEALAKEMADLVYVLYGTAVALGIDLDETVRRVHASNMSKLGEDGKPIYREDGKVLKGPNYKAPDLTGVVKELP